MSRFASILVANRGEIACRVMRTARAMGYHTVAVYTKVDARAPHVTMADAAVCIGAGPVGDSYLAADKILAAARESGAGAIHPGYGFLSENADFARACADARLVFIGPGAEAIEIMGHKAQAKRRMLAAGVACVPGYDGENQDDAELCVQAKKIGLPVMVKAAAGGGGRGMRLVRADADLASAIRLARSEADKAFGSGELILEKAIVRPRHVEVQIVADTHGTTINLGERDCSVQRRHQKVIEEAPCPAVTPALREQLGAAAVAAAQSIGYHGAGTVEFLLDEDGAFYFLEMNTRLQVEHPVTEMITGLDLVALQISVAQGEPLGLAQNDIALCGHAIEARLYAEDTAQGFLPTSGPIDLWAPAAGDGIRVDSGICTGQAISPFYDPMVAKIIACGPDREVARRRLLGALNDTVLFGVRTNKRFLAACLDKKTFIDGETTTAFIADEFDAAELADSAPTFADAAVAAVLDVHAAHERAMATSVLVSPQLTNWASAGALMSHRQYAFGDSMYDLQIIALRGAGQFAVSDGESTAHVELAQIDDPSADDPSADNHIAHVVVDGAQHVVRFLSLAIGRLYLMVDGRSAMYHDRILDAGQVSEEAGGDRVIAPMHGQMLDVHVAAGDSVVKGQCLLVMEAMKMQHEVQAAIDGVVVKVHVAGGEQVAAEDVLIEIQANDVEDAA